MMADLLSDAEKSSSKFEDDFMDPLGVNDPLTQALEEDTNALEFDIEPLKSCDIDAVLAATRQEFASMRVGQDEEMDEEPKDLFVVVDNPEKHTTTMESYITFRVTTKTTRSEFDSSEFQTRRRYNDFLWLRQRLAETQATHLVPPLPEKHSLRRLERFSPEFVKTRQAALQKFLQRIADHPVLSFNKQLHTFLTAKQWEFQAAKKEGSGFLSRMTDSFHNMSASYMMKNRAPEFTIMNDYIHTFSDKLGVMDRISQRILKEEYDYLAEINEWGPIFTLWSNSEDKLAQALGAMAKTVEKNYLALQEMTDATETEFTNPIKEYQLYADSVKTVLRRRDAIQMEYEITHEELNKKKEERDQVTISDQSNSLGAWLGKKPEDVKAQKRIKLNNQIDELTKQVEVLNDKTVCANADLKADMDRWHKNKRKDFRKIFTGMADRQIRYYQKMMKAWEDTIPLIQRTDYQASSDTDSVGVGMSHEDSLDIGAAKASMPPDMQMDSQPDLQADSQAGSQPDSQPEAQQDSQPEDY